MWLDYLRQDIGYAFRSFRRAPLFAATAVLSIAIGIAADTAVFTVVNAVFFRPPAGIAAPESLVDISGRRGRGFGIDQISWPNYVDLKQRATTLADVYAYEPFAEPTSLSRHGRAERIFGHSVTTNYFSVLGVAAAVGRVFDSSDADRLVAGAPVVLSHAFWTQRFEGDPSIVGQMIHLNSHPFTVVGVAAPTFRGTSMIATDVWMPLDTTATAGSFMNRRDLGWALLRGRLKPGVSASQAAAEVDTIGRALAQEYPAQLQETGLRLGPALSIPGTLPQALAAAFAVLLGFVSLVFLTACTNLAGVLLARGMNRQQEIAVRVAIGAARIRLITQLLTETMVLFCMGGLAGLLLARGLIALVVALLPALPAPLDLSLPLDSRVVLFTMGVTWIAALLCGVAPALQLSRADAMTTLKHGAQGLSARMRLRNAFVVAQVALSFVLVAGAGLFARTVQQGNALETGFDARDVELAELDLSLAGYTHTTGPVVIDTLVERVASLPNVQVASAAAVVPTGGRLRLGMLTHPHGRASQREHVLDAAWNAIQPGYFAALRIPFAVGRDFTPADGPGTPSVVIVSQEAARRFWPGQNAIGQTLLQHPTTIRIGENNAAITLTVVGVVHDTQTRLSESRTPEVYVPLRQQYTPRFSLITRTAAGTRLGNHVHGVVGSIDPHLPVLSTSTLEQAAAMALLPQRVTALITGSLGFVGLLLATIGVFGVTAYAVAQRTREIGIRIALGARRSDVVGLMIHQTMVMVGAGVLIGLVTAAMLGQILAAGLSGFPRVDAVTLGIVTSLFVTVGAGACHLPLRRAMRIDPVTALRVD